MSSVITVYKAPFEYGGNDILSGSYSEYLATLTHVDFQNYQHVRNGTDGAYISVGKNYDELLEYNYLHMVNDNKKDVYAFITNVVYKNNECTWLYYKVDSWATYKGQCTFKKCLVEREHSNSDTIGANTQPEPFSLSDYVCRSKQDCNDMKSISCCMAYRTKTDFCSTYGGFLDSLMYTSGTTKQINDLIKTLNEGGNGDTIAGVFYFPTNYVTSNEEGGTTHSYSFTKNHSDLNGYKPKNKKLFTYPYNFLRVTNNNGMQTDLSFELFGAEESTFLGYGEYKLATPTVMIVPTHYRGIEKDFENSIVYNAFPKSSYNVNEYQAYMRQNEQVQALNILTSSLGNLNAGNIGGAIIGATSQLVMTQVSNQARAFMPTSTKGQTSGIINNKAGSNTISFLNMTIKSEQAKIIDEYFTMYGYACNRVKVPNLTGRPNWNYVKTKDCNISGSIPSKNKQEIISIFNNGVTLWHSGANFRDYSKDNSI